MKIKDERRSMPRLRYLADVHSRVHFCRDAALVRLSGGREQLVCRAQEDARSENYDLYLNGVPLVETRIPGCGTCGTALHAGYGDGLMKLEDCLAVRDRINAGYDGLKGAAEALAPFVGLMASGLYLIADFDLFPVQRHGNSAAYFWDVPDFGSELHFTHWFAGGGRVDLDAPLFLAPTQRAAAMNPAQVDAYRQRLGEGEAFPRAVALYLNGGVALLLDGHHKAAACAAEGLPVRTLVIFPLEDAKAAQAAAPEQRRLYLHHTKGWNRYAGPLTLRDGQGNPLGRVSCLQTLPKVGVQSAAPERVPWGRVPDEYRTEAFMRLPGSSLLIDGTQLAPDEIRSLVQGEMEKPKEARNVEAILQLLWYARLFPSSKWLSETERRWLEKAWRSDA